MNNGSNKLKEIAGVFGVSAVTVSNAINRRKNVSQEKAEAIRKYAAQMGYSPSLLAQSLLKGKTNIIGLCLKCDPGNPWYSYLIMALQEKMWERNYFLSIFVAYPGIDRVRESLKYFAKLQIDALLIGPLGMVEEYGELEDMLRSFKKVVAFGTEEKLPLDSLTVDTYTAAKMAMDYMVECGHRRIGMIGVLQNEISMPQLKSRYNGYLDAMRRHGLKIDPSWILNKTSVAMIPEIEAWLPNLLADKASAPTAFYCHNDNIAAIAVKILYRHGFKIPDDVSLVGTDNHPIADQMPVGITTVGFDIDSYTSKMADILIKRLTGDHYTTNEELFRYVEPPQLFVRESVKKIT